MAKRGDHEGSYRQREAGIWEVRIAPPGGKRKSFYGKTRAEVQTKFKEAQRELERGVDLSGKTPTVGEFHDRWMAEIVKPDLRHKTYLDYEMNVRLHLKPTLGQIKLPALTPQHVQSLLTAKRKAGLSPKSIATCAGSCAPP